MCLQFFPFAPQNESSILQHWRYLAENSRVTCCLYLLLYLLKNRDFSVEIKVNWQQHVSVKRTRGFSIKIYQPKFIYLQLNLRSTVKSIIEQHCSHCNGIFGLPYNLQQVYQLYYSYKLLKMPRYYLCSRTSPY